MTRPGGTTITSEPTSEFLAALTREERDTLTALGVRRSYPRGSAVFHERQEADSVLIVLEGHVKVSRSSPMGKEAVIAFRGPGQLLGEMAAIDGRVRSATAVAIEDLSALVFPASHFLGFLHDHSHATFVLLQALSARVRDDVARLLELSAYDTLGRLSMRLLELADLHGEPCSDGVRISLPITQEELAGWIGASREATIKALHTLRKLGWLRTGRREITVLDLDALRRRAALST